MGVWSKSGTFVAVTVVAGTSLALGYYLGCKRKDPATNCNEKTKETAANRKKETEDPAANRHENDPVANCQRKTENLQEIREDRVANRKESRTSLIAQEWCFTKMNLEKISYTWTINSFSFYGEEVGKRLESSTFSTGSSDDQEKWRLLLYTGGEDDESKEFVGLYLWLKECKKNEVYAKFKIAIQCCNKYNNKSLEIQQAHKFVQGNGWGWKTFIKRDILLYKYNGMFPDDKLTVLCEVSVVADTVNVTGQGSVLIPEYRMTEDFSDMLDDPRFNDCTLCANGIEIRANKMILSKRSAVFGAMFRNNTIESQSNIVIITDIEYHVLKEMVTYMYTGAAPNLQSMAEELLQAADKYALDDLKIQCEQALGMKLTVDNACETLILADLHSADWLKRHCINFFKCHTADVMDTFGWTTMARDHAELMVETVKLLVPQ